MRKVVLNSVRYRLKSVFLQFFHEETFQREDRKGSNHDNYHHEEDGLCSDVSTYL